MADWTEVLEDYYDYLKVASLQRRPVVTGAQGYMSSHALDRNNTGLDYTSFWEAVAKVGSTSN
jgi:hypothetical protein